MSLYPRHSEVPTFVKSRCMEKEATAAQLTIFYNGQVVVFEDFPADKVEEIMSLARKGIPQSQNSSAYAHTHNRQGNHDHPSLIPNIIPQAPSKTTVCDLPIARKTSLHRFLKKRKDRIAAKAPYQTNNPNSAPNKPAESMSWLELGAKSTHI